MITDKTSLENESQPSCLGAVSGSFLSDLNFIIDNIGYDFSNGLLYQHKFRKKGRTARPPPAC